MSLDAPLVETARALAREAHGGQTRKAGGIPYFVHLESVAHRLAAHGYTDPHVLAAAYLHDLVEDQPAFTARMERTMPREVIETVRVLSEEKLDAQDRARPKHERFAGYLESLRGAGDAAARALPISCADKIDNALSIVESERTTGILTRLRTRPGEHERQLRRLRPLYASVVAPSLLQAFDEAADRLMATVRVWLVGRAVSIAADAHLGQYDKAGAPYVLHPLRLMMRARTDEERMVAVLHDVVEDTRDAPEEGRWTADRLRAEGFPRAVVKAIEHLTKRGRDETYEAFIDRVAGNALATRVKILDLEDNADLSRLLTPTDEDLARVAKYRRAIARLAPVLARRSLFVVLDATSRAAVRRLAVHEEVRGDHVTLVHAIDPASLDPAWIPGGASVGDEVELHVVAHAQDERVQALAVRIAEATRRPWDGGALHVTVSFATDARAADSNDLIARDPGAPMEMMLRGRVEWVDPL